MVGEAAGETRRHFERTAMENPDQSDWLSQKRADSQNRWQPMPPQQPPFAPPMQAAAPRRRGRLAGAGLVAAGVVAGGVLAGALTATAATGSSSTSTGTSSTSSSSAEGTTQPSNFPAHGTAAHESQEKPVTGANAMKAQAAAVKAVGSGKAGAVTTDMTGTGYEVTVTKSDGSTVEIHLDSSFAVENHGGGPAAG